MWGGGGGGRDVEGGVNGGDGRKVEGRGGWRMGGGGAVGV